MIKINEKEILDRLQIAYNYIVQNYNPKTFVMIGTCGDYNWNLMKPSMPLHSVAIMMPQLQDICLTTNMIEQKKTNLNSTKDFVEILDIRLFRQYLMQQKYSYLQVLNSRYMLINPIYESIFTKYFLDNKELINRYNTKLLTDTLVQELIISTSLPKFSYKDYFLVQQYYFFFKHYVNEEPFLNCISPKGEDLQNLWKYKYREPFEPITVQDMLSDSQILIARIEELIKKLKPATQQRKQLVIDNLTNGTMKLLTKSFRDDLPSIVSEENFVKLLTEPQKAAYKIIKEEVSKGSLLNIGKLHAENHMRDEPFTQVLKLMEYYNIAKIQHAGKERTYITMNLDE